MRLTLLAVGRLKDGAERALFAHYLERFRFAARPLGLGPLAVHELAESRAPAAHSRKEAEAAGLMRRAPQGCHLMALDEGGELVTSKGLAALLKERREAGTAHLCLMTGGPDGHGPLALERAHRLLSLGRITLPHGLARIILAEQLYRAATILTGHPYHRE